MSLPWDPEVAAAVRPLLAARAQRGLPSVGDIAGRRANSARLFEVVTERAGPPARPVEVSHHEASAGDGVTVPLRLFAPQEAADGPLLIYLHGGGMIAGTLDQYDALLRWLSARAELAVLAPEYRLAPEHPHPAPVEDCYATLRWAADHAAQLCIDPARIGIIGASAGGGLAAGVTLLARDRGGPAIARQLLIYPMLDDRTVSPDPQIGDTMLWSYDDNVTGWSALLPDAGEPPIHAAPARADDLSGLPPAYIDVGGLDIFRDEDVAYATRLARSGVPAELHVLPGVPHAFDILAPEAAVSQRALEGRLRFLREL